MPIKNPLSPEHYKMLDDAGRLLADFAAYRAKLEACGEDCQEMIAVADELERSRSDILREFPRVNKPA